MNNEPDDEQSSISSPTREEDFDEPPHKIGDVLEENGVRRVVTGLRRSIGGHFWAIDTSAEPLAKEQGYITLDQSLGFKNEHFPPPFVERGTPRETSSLREADWNFSELLSRPIEERRLALFHELARDSARMREACRVYLAGKAADDKWGRKMDEATTACEASHIAMQACFGEGRQAWSDAQSFLRKRLDSFPYGVRNLLLESIAKDVPWSEVSEADKQELLAAANKKAEEGLKHRSLAFNDLPGGGPGWPFDEPIQFAYDSENRGQWGQPSYHYNDGIPRRPVLASKGNGKDAQRILSESLELCVCLNYRDEEILAAFQKWLDWRRQGLNDDLAEFKVSSKRPYTKLKGNNVDAALKGVAALRLMAAFSRQEAVGKFDAIFFPNAKQRNPDGGNLAQQAEIAKEWQQMFFRYCPLDSAGPVNPDKGLYDRECPMCYNLEKIEQEPRHKLPDFSYPFRCKVCDHRASMGWTGQEWQRMERD